MKLSQRIQIYSGNETSDVAKASSEDDNAKAFHKSFPFFVWLLRDVVLALPEGCHSLKDYFLTKVKSINLFKKIYAPQFEGNWSSR